MVDERRLKSKSYKMKARKKKKNIIFIKGNGMIDLSIIIVNFNTRELLRQCLQSLYNTTRNVNFEVHVVDNDSSDGSTEMVKKEFPQVKLIENKRNEGFSRANNKAIPRTKGRYVLLLNSDTVVLIQELYKMVAFMDERREAGVVGCKLINKDGNLQLSAAWFPSLAKAFFGGEFVPKALGRLLGMERFPGQTYLTTMSHEEIQDVDWVCGACLMVRKAVIEDVGLLDEKLFMYGEEIDWCFRIKKAGWKVMYYPNAKIVHYQRGSTKIRSQFELAMLRLVFSERYVYCKHHNSLSSRIYNVIITIIAIVKFLLWGLLLPFIPNKNNALTHLSYHRAILKSLFVYRRMLAE